MSKILQAVCGLHEFRFWHDTGVIEVKGAILAQAKKAVALAEAFHRLTPDEQAAFHLFLSCC